MSPFSGAVIRSHSEIHDLKTNVLYLYMIPLIYFPPNEPNILLQRPIKNLKMDDCWLMKGSKVYVEIELGKSVEVHHFDYYHFNQNELSDSTPKIITIEAITNNNTLVNLGLAMLHKELNMNLYHSISSKTTYIT
uniref:SUN domain-containing protein n=1 Tax=Panagrolaimus davidi TaxID=227884 RepID=A0A914PAX1_9BILA